MEAGPGRLAEADGEDVEGSIIILYHSASRLILYIPSYHRMQTGISFRPPQSVICLCPLP